MIILSQSLMGIYNISNLYDIMNSKLQRIK